MGLAGNSRENLLSVTDLDPDCSFRACTGAPAVYNAVAMNLSRTARLLLALASGVALALAFPLFNFPLLGWIAPAMLIVAVLNETSAIRFAAGMVAGRGVLRAERAVVLHRDAPVRAAPGDRKREPFSRWWCLRRRCFTRRLRWEWHGLAVRRRRAHASPRHFCGCRWNSRMMHLPDIGFPWNLLGYVAAGNLAFVQLTAITGIFGLSLVVASYNALAAWAVLQMSRAQAGAA